MKLNEIEAKGLTFSRKASELNQKFCFAGIAIIWLLKISLDSGKIQLSNLLLISLLLFSLSLLTEILYYSISAKIWDNKYHSLKKKLNKKERKLKEEDIQREVLNNESIPWLVFFFKISLTTISFILIIIHLFQKVIT